MPYPRDAINRLHAYAPGEQPESLDVVKLNTNENPYPPAPAVLDAVADVSAESLRRYPPPAASRFRQLAGQTHGLSNKHVLAVNGGDELLRLAITVFCQPGVGNPNGQGGLGVCAPTYSLYPVLAAIAQTPLIVAPSREDFSPPEDLAQTWNRAGCRLGMIVNPHAPSGYLESLERLASIAQAFKGVLLIDEAYVDFAKHDALALIKPPYELDNVILLRTLSKGYSLAGLRFGYALAAPNLIAAMDKARDSYNTDILSQAAAIAALQNCDHARESWRKVTEQRTRVTESLKAMGFTVCPSQTNFILAAPPNDAATPTADKLYQLLKRRGVFVRYFDQDRLRDKLRITIGTPEQNDALLTALRDLAHADINKQ